MKQNIPELIAQGESMSVEFKGPMAFEGDDRVELTKDLIAMANTRDGGTIVIGVAEDKQTGKLQVVGLTPEQARSFDVTKVANYVHQKAAPPVHLHSTIEEISGKQVVVLTIPEFDDQPLICTKEGATQNGKTVFRQSSILVRTPAGSSEPITDESSMRQLLAMAVRKRSDSLLADISRLLQGTPKIQAPAQDLWEREKQIALSDRLQPPIDKQGIGVWRFSVHPLDTHERLASPADLQKAVSSAIVRLRGWDFPHLDHGKLEIRQDNGSGVLYAHDATNWQDKVEAFTVFETGLAEVTRCLCEDLEDRAVFPYRDPAVPGVYLDWLDALCQIGEFVTFIIRFYRALNYGGVVRYRVEVTQTNDRQLNTREPRRPFYHGYQCRQPSIVVEADVHLTTLGAAPVEECLLILRRVFSLFQWTNPSEEMLRDDYQKLFSRQV